MGHLSYEESKKVVVKGLILLGVLTLVEVAIALFALPAERFYFML